MPKRLDLDYVKNYFEEQECECLEDTYINNYTLMKYRCECGNISYIKFSDFKNLGRRCPDCVDNRPFKNKRFKVSVVRDVFYKAGCVPLFEDEDYVNSWSKLKYQCECGSISEISFSGLRGGSRCKKCGFKKISKSKTYDIEFVRSKFIEGGCVPLFEEYHHSGEKLKYQCGCGEISYMTFVNFLRGKRCKNCGLDKSVIKRSGVNHYNWQGGISKDPYCCVWKNREYKEDIKERDGYKCQNPICNRKYKRLHIHHIDYDKENCHHMNLITLCMSCNSKANYDREWHKDFYTEMMNKRYVNG